jgi:hypothetical protein
MLISTDYLVVGAGATGLAFADALVAESDAEVTVIDRREAPGGHWQDAYPFVRLHSPSANYGVNSLALGDDTIDEVGKNAGYYERATGEEVRGYFDEVTRRLRGTGQVRVLTGYESLDAGSDAGRIRKVDSGELHDLVVRRKMVDARYQEGSIPATHAPSFDVAPSARFVPVGELPAAARSDSSYCAVLGSGKTAVDACIWLLDNGVPPDRIRWVRPRDAWFHDRRHFQPLEQVGAIMEGLSIDAEAGARAESIEDLFARLEDSGRVMRIDPASEATMYRGTMLSTGELEALRQIEHVVRLGRVRRIEGDRIILEHGEAQTGPEVLHVDCTAVGISNAPATPVFEEDRVVLQQVRHLSPCFNAALLGFVEAHYDDDVDKNRLCPPQAYPNRVEDWPRMMRHTWTTMDQWSGDPDLSTWVAESRLNLVRALPEHAGEPSVRASIGRYLTHLGAAIERLGELDASIREWD